MVDYSVAIRTVGKAGKKFEKEILSIQAQTIRPKHIYVLLAEGFDQPAQIGREEYIIVPKGLVHQRALSTKYVDSEYILILDDDVYLPENAVEFMFNVMEEKHVDCIIPDTFPSHKMSLWGKVSAYLSNDVSPRRNDEYAIRIKPSGAFSYNNNPRSNALYMTESGAGPAFFIKTSKFKMIKYEDEYWVDSFPAGTFYEDQLMFYKLHVNGAKLLLWGDSGVLHLDAGSNNQKEKSYDKLLYRSMANYVIWHRSIYNIQSTRLKKYLCTLSFNCRFFKALIVRCLYSLFLFDNKYFVAYWKGRKKGMSFVRSKEYLKLPTFIIDPCD